MPSRVTRVYLDDSPVPSPPSGHLAAATAKRKKIDAADKRAAAIGLLGVLVARTGCTGPGCTGDHDSHLTAGRELAMVVDAMPDPKALGTRNPDGYTLKLERKAAAT